MTGNKAGLADKLQKIDRRILYLILLIVIAIPTLWPVNIPNSPLRMSRDLWNTINDTPPNKMVLLSSTWTKNTRGENQGQMQAIVEQMMSRHIRFAISTFDPRGSQVALNLVQSLAKKYNYIYGQNWVSFGYQPNGVNYVKGLSVDLLATVKRDAVLKQPLSSLPVMKGIHSADNFQIVVEISAASTQYYWIQYLKPGIKVGFACTSVMAPESLPYYTSHQLAGLLWGAKGAYDYEQLNVEHHTGNWGAGRQYMGPLSAAFGLVILSILVGNIAMFSSRKNRRI
jgi:hypothetical protein